MSSEPLVNMPLERWGELQNVFKFDWPRCVSGYLVLENQRCLIQKKLEYGFQVYCPFGDVWNGMVAINDKHHYYEVIIQCPRDDTEKLEDALRRTKIVDWQKNVILPFARNEIIECVKRVVGHHVKIDYIPVEKFVLDEQVIFDDIQLPPGISFGPVSLEHLELIESTWPHRYAGSLWYFRLLINAKFGYGLFEGNELVTWMFFCENGELKHLYTVKNHRRKGYAELIAKLISNILNKEGRYALSFIVTDNFNSIELFNKLGFTKSEPVKWGFLKIKE